MSNKKRKIEVADPWERHIKGASYTSDDLIYATKYGLNRPKFHIYPGNLYLDIYKKRAALKASESVVSLVSYSDGVEFFQCSGTILESNGTRSVILTSADLIRVRSPRDGNNESSSGDEDEIYESTVLDPIHIVVHLSDGQGFDGRILTYDFHYNLAAIEIQSDACLKVPCLRLVDDSVTVDPNVAFQKTHFQLLPHSDSFNLTPGDTVMVLGRYSKKPFDLMIAPGEFSIDRCEYECKELFRANCRITRSGVGGPLINHFGEVIGICFYDILYTPFLPVNLASKWWYHSKRNGEIHRPLLSMELTNLYAVSPDILEKVIQKFPNTFKGVIVEEVTPGSSAQLVGICPNDVIVEFGGKRVQSFLELLEMMWDNVGNPINLVVLRSSDGVSVPISMMIDEVPPEKLYCWPFLDNVR